MSSDWQNTTQSASEHHTHSRARAEGTPGNSMWLYPPTLGLKVPCVPYLYSCHNSGSVRTIVHSLENPAVARRWHLFKRNKRHLLTTAARIYNCSFNYTGIDSFVVTKEIKNRKRKK